MANLLLLSLATLASAYASVIPEISGYSKVSTNGASSASEPRNLNLSPVYHAGKHLKVYDGEVVDYSHKYSTLDKEMVAKLDGKTRQKQAEDRFVPSAVRLQSPSGSPGSSSSLASQSSVSGSSSSISSGGYATLPQSYSSNTYQFPDDDKVPKNNNNKFKIANTNGNNNDHDNLPSITADGFSMAVDSYSKIPHSYELQPDKVTKNYPSYLDKLPSKPNYQPAPSYIDPDDPYLPNDNDNDNDNDNNNDNHNDDEDHRSHGNFPDLTYPHEYIYDHPPDDYYYYHHHHHHHHLTTTSTTEEPINDQRLNKRPYSYYYIGKKLWYLPLYFSIYFIIYITALVLKSVARHKINFPANLAEAAQGARHLHYNNNNYTSDLTQRVLESIEKFISNNKNKK